MDWDGLAGVGARPAGTCCVGLGCRLGGLGRFASERRLSDRSGVSDTGGHIQL